MSTSMMGSSITGRAWANASLKALRAAIWNAMSFESTGWCFPSNTVALTSTMW